MLDELLMVLLHLVLIIFTELLCERVEGVVGLKSSC